MKITKIILLLSSFWEILRIWLVISFSSLVLTAQANFSGQGIILLLASGMMILPLLPFFLYKDVSERKNVGLINVYLLLKGSALAVEGLLALLSSVPGLLVLSVLEFIGKNPEVYKYFLGDQLPAFTVSFLTIIFAIDFLFFFHIVLYRKQETLPLVSITRIEEGE